MALVGVSTGYISSLSPATRSAKMSKFRKFSVLSIVSLQDFAIEATSFFFVFTQQGAEFAHTNMYFQKFCGHNATEEPNLSKFCDDEKAGLKAVARINRTYRFGFTVVALILVILASTWSDRHPKFRKRLIVFIAIGQILQLTSSLIQSYFWHWPAKLILLSEFLGTTVFLGNLGFRLFAMISMCDLTTEENRTTRLTLLSTVETLCMTFSSPVSGYLMHHYGFRNIFSIYLLLASMAFFCSLFIKEAQRPIVEEATVTSIFNVKRFFTSFKVVFKRRKGRQNLIISILCIISVLVFLPLRGKKLHTFIYFRI